MDDKTEVARKTESTRKFVGRMIFWIGLILLISGVTLTLVVSLAVASSGLTTTPFTYQTSNTISLVGLVTLVIGVIIRYATNTFSKDGLWTLQTGPYVK